jgi:ABC-type polysaccharide/polyol phosphate transport system ATPase subunit
MAASSVRRLCQPVLLIQDGTLLADGPPDQVIARYEELLQHPIKAIS